MDQQTSGNRLIGKRVRVISGAYTGQRGRVEAVAESGKFVVILDEEIVGEFAASEFEVVPVRWRTILVLFYVAAAVLWAVVIAKGLMSRGQP